MENLISQPSLELSTICIPLINKEVRKKSKKELMEYIWLLINSWICGWLPADPIDGASNEQFQHSWSGYLIFKLV
jgi:hypothetical protein